MDGNYPKKGALIDYLVCSPKLLKAALKKKNIKKGFVKGGMIDEATGSMAQLRSARGLNFVKRS